MTIRFGDSGFGNRLQFGASMGSLATVYSTQYTQATLGSAWRNIVIQRKSGQISLYIDKVLQTVRNSNYGGTAVTSFADATSVGALATFVLGYQSGVSGSGNEGAYYDNFKVSKIARY
jgi:hypothetical protein